jgi:hypothetical protein
MAERDEKGAGRADPLRHFAKKIDDDGGDTSALQLSSHQTHGLIAHGSDRDQKGDIDAVAYQVLGSVRSMFTDEPCRCGNRAHQRQVPVVHRSDSASLLQFPKALQGEGHVDVLLHAAMIKGLTAVGINQPLHVDITRYFPEGRIAAADGFIETCLAGHDQTGTGDETHPALGHGLFERRPRNGVYLTPSVGLQKQTDRQRKLAQLTHASSRLGLRPTRMALLRGSRRCNSP